MIIESANFKLKLEEFQKGHTFSPSNETEEKVFWLVKQWVNNVKSFDFLTSGSTGKPKKVRISRDKIIYSTRATFKAIDPKNVFKRTLLCLDPGFIGGAMVVFRALIQHLDLYIIEPTSNITAAIPPDFNVDLVSIVPMQYKHLQPKDFEKLGTILVGGGALEEQMVHDELSPNVYATYGMTETVSHIALRKVQNKSYSTVGDVEVDLCSEETLMFKGEITDHKWLKTNDIGVVNSKHSFEWIGRRDFVINTGGIKVNPEAIEKKLDEQISSLFMVSFIPDAQLGQKVVLLLAGTKPSTLDFGKLEKYETPKIVFEEQPIFQTASGKIDRIKTQRQLLESLQ